MKVPVLILLSVAALVANGKRRNLDVPGHPGGKLVECESFHDLGFIRIGPNPTTNLSERVKEAIDHIGMEHRHRHPELPR